MAALDDQGVGAVERDGETIAEDERPPGGSDIQALSLALRRPLSANGLTARKSSRSGGAARRVRVLKAQPSFVASCGASRSRRW